MKTHAVVTGLVFLTCLSAQEFTQTCDNPKFPDATVSAIDRCGINGSASAQSPDGLQNARKNSFCASGNATVVTCAKLTARQTDTAAAEKKLHYKAGTPPKSRAFLGKLGEGSLVTFEGFVFEARQECKETVNCGTDAPNVDASHDIHISLLDHKPTTTAQDEKSERDAEECTGFVAEMIPHHRPPEWTACNVNGVAEKQLRVRITGQSFFDGSHLPCNGTQPVGSNPKRATLWEIHPIYSFEVCPNGDCANGGWVPLTEFAAGKTTCHNKPCAESSTENRGKRKRTNALR